MLSRVGSSDWLGGTDVAKYLWSEQAKNQNPRKKPDAEFSPTRHLPPDGLVLRIDRPRQHPTFANSKAINSCKNDGDQSDCEFDD